MAATAEAAAAGRQRPAVSSPAAAVRPRLAPENGGEFKALSSARARSGPILVDGERVVPGASGLAADAARRGLPTSLLAVLVLLTLCALTAAFPVVRRRVLSRRKP